MQFNTAAAALWTILSSSSLLIDLALQGGGSHGGGYSGNPTITPLIRESDSQDTILSQSNPRERPGTPRSAAEILNRLNEVSFNTALMKELRMMALLRQVADP